MTKEQIKEFMTWLIKETDAGDWDDHVLWRVEKKLQELLEEENERTKM